MAQYQPVSPTGGGEPPLDWPFYGIGFGAAVKRFFTKYATFDGRASRGEFWWIVVLNALVYVVLGILVGITSAVGGSVSDDGTRIPGAGVYIVSSIFSLYYLGIIVPSLALGVRRLHDTGRSGWYILFGLIPFVGGIILLVFYASDTTPSAVQYGPPGDPGYPPAVGPYGQQPVQNPYGQQPVQNPYGQNPYGQQPPYPTQAYGEQPPAGYGTDPNQPPGNR